ncbi:hypothetical protein CANARDRAFT_27887 [[Candida] arabinofermentans NRRL YB-2248]|uniref:Amino acid permease/ SLC12A domain-containing protein n=1 Tax=[Candida] arabinofermentans NRRL YB-2248 TaxID=983967 RepID=A0A1E4T221_9ASCO|nr:hypothetical protein CANARDRAFT_27887 [[Candida] arabinofermentans NRRL YB-2248]
MNSSNSQLSNSAKEKKVGLTTQVTSSSLSDSYDPAQHNGLRKNFSFWSVLGVGFGLTNSWCGISASMVAGISSGGCMMIIYGIIIIAAISSCVAISLSELTSAIPNAGGQYVWTKVLAPKDKAAFWSFMCGNLAWIGSIFTCTSVGISLATMVCAMWKMNHPDFEQKSWHVFVIFQILHWLTFIFNCYERWLPTFASISLYTTVLSWLVITITMLGGSKGEFQSPHFVFVEFNNGTGWSSSAIAFIVGLINPAWSFSCLDSATHMAEEVVNPERIIPLVICSTVAIGFITSFSYVLSLFFCIKDIDAILNDTTGFPVMQIYNQVLNNKSAAIFLTFLVMASLFGCNIQCHTWQQRLCWSFSRDNGIPGSRYWSKVDPKTGVPLNAHIFSSVIVALVGFVYLGSTTAYNALVTGCITFLVLSYAIPVVFLLKLKRNIKHGPFWLGKIGLFSNIVLLCWTLFVLVFFSFPSVMPATRDTMNYASCATVGVIAYGVIYWFIRGKRVFILRDEEEEMQTIRSIYSHAEQCNGSTMMGLDLEVSKNI